MNSVNVTLAQGLAWLAAFVFSQTPAAALPATKLELSTMSVGPVAVYSDQSGRSKVVTGFGTVLITDQHHSFGYNDANKLCIEYSSPQEFAQSRFVAFLNQFHPAENLFNPWIAVDTTKTNGWNLTRYKRTAVAAAVRRSPRLGSYYEIVSATHDLSLPYDWVNPYVSALGAPCPAGNAPLYFYAYLGQRLIEKRVELLGVTNENVPPDFFSAPQGYTQTKDDRRVFLTPSNIEKLVKMNHRRAVAPD